MNPLHNHTPAARAALCLELALRALVADRIEGLDRAVLDVRTLAAAVKRIEMAQKLIGART